MIGSPFQLMDGRAAIARAMRSGRRTRPENRAGEWRRDRPAHDRAREGSVRMAHRVRPLRSSEPGRCAPAGLHSAARTKIGRAAGRERVWQYGVITVGAESLKTKDTKT